MQLQAAGAGEGLGAASAAIRFLPGVRAFVLLHGVSVAEGAAAERAAVRTLAGVDPQVSPQVSSLTEALGAEGAAVRPLARVRAQVAPQIGRLGEGLAAPVAGVGLPLLLQMEAEPSAVTERLAAAGAAVYELRDERCDRGVFRRPGLLRERPGSGGVLLIRRQLLFLRRVVKARLNVSVGRLSWTLSARFFGFGFDPCRGRGLWLLPRRRPVSVDPGRIQGQMSQERRRPPERLLQRVGFRFCGSEPGRCRWRFFRNRQKLD